MIKFNFSFCLLIVFVCCSLVGHAQHQQSLAFIENKNQWEPVVKYKADIPGGAVFVTNAGFTYSFYNVEDVVNAHEKEHEGANAEEAYKSSIRKHAYRINFLNAQTQNITYTTVDKRKTYYNYFLGNDRSKWAGKVAAYNRINQHNIYNGIDMTVYSEGNSMKYDFIVAAGADPSQIILNFDGVTPQINAEGQLRITTSVNEVIEGAPVSYQLVDGQKVNIKSRYKQLPDGNIVFEFPDGYNENEQLVIDPTLVFGTFSGGTNMTFGFSACYDATGSLYAGGEAFGTGWPVTTGAFQEAFGDGVDCSINRYTSDGSDLVYSTYYGGNSSETPNNMNTNVNNELVMMGYTMSPNLPTSTGCYDATLGGVRDFFVVHFTADGTDIVGSTYVGGQGDDCTIVQGEIVVDAAGDLIVAGASTSTDFPVTANAVQSTSGGASDGVIFKLSSDCSQLLYGTYLGGGNTDACYALVLSDNGNVVACGNTASTNFPTTAGALHTTAPGGGDDGFVSIINFNTGLVASTYLGTTAVDGGAKVQLDGSGNVLVIGQTQGNYPISAGVYNIPNGDIYIDRLMPDLSASMQSTRLGNSDFYTFIPTAFMFDNCGSTYMCGYGVSPNLPVTPDAFQSTSSNGFYFCVLDGGWQNLTYATYYGDNAHVDGGSSRFDPQGIVYHSVCTSNPTFPTTATAYSPTKLASSYDIASFKFDFDANINHAVIDINANSNDSGCAPMTVTFVNNSVGGITYFWDFDDGGFSNEFEPTHTFLEPGIYDVRLVSGNPAACDTFDTAIYKIYVFEPTTPQIIVQDTAVCSYETTITLSALIPNLTESMTIHWTPQNAILSDPNQATITVDLNIAQNFHITVIDSAGDGLCIDSSSASIAVSISPLPVDLLLTDTIVCYGTQLGLMTETPLGNYAFLYSSTSPDNFIWTTAGQNTFINAYEAATYYVTVTDVDLGCSGTDSVFIDVYPNNASTINVSDTGVCPGDSVQLLANGGVTYSWVPGIYLSDSTVANPVATPKSSTDYTVYIISAQGCVDSQKVHLDQYSAALVSLPDSVRIYPGETYQMDTDGNCLYFQWFPPSGLTNANISNPIASPEVRTRYFVTAQTEHGCETVDSIDVLVEGTVIDMPNAFAPGNGSNNIFKPSRRGIARLNKFMIFDRWGVLVYESTNIDEGWDGTYKGKPQPVGVYSYIIDAVKDNGEPFVMHGNVTLLR